MPPVVGGCGVFRVVGGCGVFRVVGGCGVSPVVGGCGVFRVLSCLNLRYYVRFMDAHSYYMLYSYPQLVPHQTLETSTFWPTH